MNNGYVEHFFYKADIDYAFSLSKEQWNSKSEQAIGPETNNHVSQQPTGARITKVNPLTGVSTAVQPFYRDDMMPPYLFIVGSYFPPGKFPQLTDDLKDDLEQAAQKEVGPAYSVRLHHEVTDELETVEFWITEL